MRKNACKAFPSASGKKNVICKLSALSLQFATVVRLRFLKHMHASNSSLRSFGSFSFESHAGFMRRNSFFCRLGKVRSGLYGQKTQTTALFAKPAFRFTKNGASSMAFVLNRAYEKATCVLKEDCFDSAFLSICTV